MALSILDALAERALEQPTRLGQQMVEASANAITETLPPCPYKPPGADVTHQWSSKRPPRLLLRCSHEQKDSGPHCWAISDGSPTEC